MFSKSIGGALCAGILVLGACARQPEPVRAPIQPQPIYNKYGDVVGCEGGVFVPDARNEIPCQPPKEGCSDPAAGITAGYFQCNPRDDPDDRPRDPQEPRDPQRPGTPTGGPIN